MMEDSKQGISFGDGVSLAVRRSGFAIVTIQPKDADDLRFKLALPKRWKEYPGVAFRAVGPWRTLSSFAGSDKASVTILQTSLPYEVNLRDWMEFQCFKFGFEIGSMENRQADRIEEIHVVGRTHEGEHLRMVMMADGPRILWMIGMCPASLATPYQESFGLGAASLQIVGHSGKTTREELIRYKESAGHFEMLYPASWTPAPLKALLPAKVGVDFRLVEEGEMLAYVRVESDSRYPEGEEGLRKVFELAIQEVEESGIKVHSMEPVPPSALAGERERWVGECQVPTGLGQIALLFRRAPEAWLNATMIAPDKTLNPLAWMRGKRFFEIAVASLKPSL
jgi:hypothetical protein